MPRHAIHGCQYRFIQNAFAAQLIDQFIPKPLVP
jgi:hypothetical protein